MTDFLAGVCAFPFKHPKSFIVLALVAVIGFSAIRLMTASTSTHASQATAPTPNYQIHEPATKYVIQTTSRAYFVDSYTDVNGTVKAPSYWDYSQTKWVYVKKTLTLDRKYFGVVNVYAQ